jgi:hypothetical protein
LFPPLDHVTERSTAYRINRSFKAYQRDIGIKRFQLVVEDSKRYIGTNITEDGPRRRYLTKTEVLTARAIPIIASQSMCCKLRLVCYNSPRLASLRDVLSRKSENLSDVSEN